jgi:phosphatidylglycerophosphate synthase
MFFPTWLDMIILLVTFCWLTMQQMRMLGSGFRSVPRMAVQAVAIIVMFMVVIYNGKHPGLSSGLSVATLVMLGAAYYFQRKVPPRLPTEPKF